LFRKKISLKLVDTGFSFYFTGWILFFNPSMEGLSTIATSYQNIKLSEEGKSKSQLVAHSKLRSKMMSYS